MPSVYNLSISVICLLYYHFPSLQKVGRREHFHLFWKLLNIIFYSNDFHSVERPIISYFLLRVQPTCPYSKSYIIFLKIVKRIIGLPSSGIYLVIFYGALIFLGFRCPH